MQIVAAILRFVQLIFAAIVLGLSVSLAKGQAPSEFKAPGVPATTGYSSFAGGFGMLIALIGFISIFVEFLQGIVMLVLDTLGSLIFLAGGIAVAVGLRGVSCGNSVDTYNNNLLNGGLSSISKLKVDGFKLAWKDVDQRKSRCQMDEADSAFMFMSFIICAGLVAHTFWFGGRMAGTKSRV